MITRQQQHIFKILIVAGISFRALGVISKLTGTVSQFSTLKSIFLESEMDPSSALTDEEYRQSLGSGYIFFEITEPDQLSFTYKVVKTERSHHRTRRYYCRPTLLYLPPAGM